MSIRATRSRVAGNSLHAVGRRIMGCTRYTKNKGLCPHRKTHGLAGGFHLCHSVCGHIGAAERQPKIFYALESMGRECAVAQIKAEIFGEGVHLYERRVTANACCKIAQENLNL